MRHWTDSVFAQTLSVEKYLSGFSAMEPHSPQKCQLESRLCGKSSQRKTALLHGYDYKSVNSTHLRRRDSLALTIRIRCNFCRTIHFSRIRIHYSAYC